MMQKISESDIKEALFEYYDAEIRRFEERAEQLPHRFSLRFKIRMRIFFWKIDHDKPLTKPTAFSKAIPMRKLGTILAAILLAILALCVTAIAIQNAYRLIERVFPKYSDVHYENPVSQEHGEFVLYEIAELPEGFVKYEDESYFNEKLNKSVIYYYKGDARIVFEQRYADEMQKRLNTEDAELIEMTIGSKDGYYFTKNGVEHFTWVEGEFSFLISTYSEKDILSSLVMQIKPIS